MLAELDVPHRLIPYNMLAGDHLKKEFRRINPNGKLPAIVDHAPQDGRGPFLVFESGAILLYLSEKHEDAFMPKGLRGRSLAQQWLMWQMAGFGPMHGQAHHFIRYAPEGQEYPVNRYRNEAIRLLNVLERRLEEAAYMAGDDYSIADMATWPWVRAVRAIQIDLESYTAIRRWYAEIEKRPGVQRGTEITNERNLASLRPELTEEAWSNLFGENMLKSGR
ncbi:hypothetical protein HY3_15050 [Hyphomonas pacifica]|uniref:Glutathione S-transferase n=2 Tax=Hyphomonas pacifica TaxID=1280941 RepID=A0A8B2PIT2_9PROT|nr:hypothetical protein HY3_15050 [Hyphomonas pacifica]